MIVEELNRIADPDKRTTSLETVDTPMTGSVDEGKYPKVLVLAQESPLPVLCWVLQQRPDRKEHQAQVLRLQLGQRSRPGQEYAQEPRGPDLDFLYEQERPGPVPGPAGPAGVPPGREDPPSRLHRGDLAPD
ncbi:hypothetical protein OJ253_681 [Cryptosporidium canis]|uniref:Uncharacterized protein n=1 Tax=Cryptosporidium canis TaxID=195482 RepID=A0A9D5DIB7_9CRYT|nr:hypothetical protein OJ253_681 [Cryptosporidium canis]